MRETQTAVTLRCFNGALHFNAILHHEDGAYWGEVPELPGCFSAGDTRSEVEADTVKAVELHLFGLFKRKEEEEAERSRTRIRRRRASAPLPGSRRSREAAFA